MDRFGLHSSLVKIFIGGENVVVGVDGTITLRGTSGIKGFRFDPGSDVDVDIIGIDVTGAPKFWWDEAPGAFTFSEDVVAPNFVGAIGGVTPAAVKGTTGEFTTSLILSGTAGAAGMDVNPGSDTDADLLTVGVTDTPKLWWDEDPGAFTFSQPVTGAFNGTIGGTTPAAGSFTDVTVSNDILLASGSVINWDSGDVTLTHSAAKLTWGGDGAVELDFNNHEMTNVDIDSGAIDGTPVGAAVASTGAFTSLTASGATTLSGATTIGDATGDALTFHPSAWTLTNAVTITGTWADLGVVTTVDINAGTIGGVTLDGTISGTPTWASTQSLNTSGLAATATLAADATTLETPRAINGVDFDGSAPITVTAAAGTLTGTELKSSVVTSSLTSVGTLLDLTVTNTIAGSIDGNAATASAVDAGNLSGNTLAGGVLASSLTSLGTLLDLTVTNTITGSISGNAATVSTYGAGDLTGATLAGGVTASSLTSVGTLANLTVTNTITGSVSGASGSSPAASLTGDTIAAGVTASSLTSVGTLSGGAVPASLVTTGTFGSGAYVFDNGISGITTLGTSGACTLDSGSSGSSFGGALQVGGPVGIGAAGSGNADLLLEAGRLMLKESATPSADAGYGKVYTKTDDELYFQDGDGTEHRIQVSDYAGIEMHENSNATTIQAANIPTLLDDFAINQPEIISDGDYTENRVTVGKTADYCVTMSGTGESDAVNKTFDTAIWRVSSTTQNITEITEASPCVVTIVGHGLIGGEYIYIADLGGQVQTNGQIYKVVYIGEDTFSLATLADAGVDSTLYTEYTSGGTIQEVNTTKVVHCKREYVSANKGYAIPDSVGKSLTAGEHLMAFVMGIDDDTNYLAVECHIDIHRI